MYYTNRFVFKYGNEEDELDVVGYEWDSFEKALKYANRYAKGIKFAGVEIRDENYHLVYEITSEGDVYDYR